MTFEVQRERIGQIDGLRAFSALSVLLAHTFPFDLLSRELGDGGVLAAVKTWGLYNGHLGVCIFFIISGYVIPFSIEKYRSHNGKRFVVSRFFRLYPAYWLSIALALAVGLEQPSWRELSFNLTMLQGFFGIADLIGVFWSLKVELAFYVLTLLAWRVGVTGNWALFEKLFVLSLAGLIAAKLVLPSAGVPFPYGTALYIELMLFGTWMRVGEGRRRTQVLASAGMIGFFLIMSLLTYYPEAFGQVWQWHFLKFALAVLLFLVMTHWLPLKDKVSRYLGQISYSVYLLHVPIHFFVFQRIFGAPEGGLATTAGFFVSLAASLAASALVYHAVELPMIALGKRIGRRWAETPAAA